MAQFVRGINLFASARDDSPASLAARAALVRPDESMLLLQVPAIVVPPGLFAVRESKGVQIVAPSATRFESDGEDIVRLGDSDVPEMLALATLTQHAPFLARTHVMRSFLGIRIDGRLVAMAGADAKGQSCGDFALQEPGLPAAH